MTALSLRLSTIEPPMPLFIQTEYALKLFFPNPTFAQIYYEAIANALDANATEVAIHISTDIQIDQRHLEITIRDNGEGFTDKRFERFKESQESDAYHKGLGRLIYLRYFSQVSVEASMKERNGRLGIPNSLKATVRLWRRRQVIDRAPHYDLADFQEYDLSLLRM